MARAIAAFESIERPDIEAIERQSPREELLGYISNWDWYRQHSWQDFAAELPTEQFDPFEFPSLPPTVYRYFTPGILAATFGALAANQPARAFWEEYWIFALVPLKSRIEAFRFEYLPHFSTAQKEAIAFGLVTFSHRQIARENYADADLERAIAQVWSPA